MAGASAQKTVTGPNKNMIGTTMSRIILSRRLTEGVGGWLQYEYHCNRSELFSEKYLSVPIGGILNSLYDRKVYAEAMHPVLAPVATGSGRRPEIDFAVLDPYPEFKIAIESKWIGRRSVQIEAIIWDLIRLEMIAYECKARCFFVLGGQRRSLDRLFDSKTFTGPVRAKPSTGRKILRTDSNKISTLVLDSTFPNRTALLKRLFQNHQDTPMPCRILTRRSSPFPSVCQASQYQVYTWEVMSKHSKRRTFLPKTHKDYSV
jgi:hypothetical protein